MPTLFKRYQIEFRSVNFEDIEQLRQWRNRDDIRLMMVDQTEITGEQQERWFATLSAQTNKHHFCLWFRDTLIGYANVSLDAKVASTGLYIGHEKYRGSMLALCVGVGLTEWCFETLPITHISAQVVPHNQAALRFNHALGYQEMGQDKQWVHLSKTKAEFEQAREKLLPVLARFA